MLRIVLSIFELTAVRAAFCVRSVSRQSKRRPGWASVVGSCTDSTGVPRRPSFRYDDPPNPMKYSRKVWISKAKTPLPGRSRFAVPQASGVPQVPAWVLRVPS